MRELRDLSCLVLCGGQGTRLREVIPDRPKSLAEVNGRPFLFYLLDQIARFGCSAVTLCTGYMGEKIEERVGRQYGRLKIRYSHEKVSLGTAGAVKAAIGKVASRTILVLNGDSYIEYDLEKFSQAHLLTSASFSMLLARVLDSRRYGLVQINDRQQITGFLEKSTDAIGSPGLINAGTYLIQRKVVEAFPTEIPLSMETNIIPALLPSRLHGFVSGGQFIDIGTPASYLEASEFFGKLELHEKW